MFGFDQDGFIVIVVHNTTYFIVLNEHLLRFFFVWSHLLT